MYLPTPTVSNSGNWQKLQGERKSLIARIWLQINMDRLNTLTIHVLLQQDEDTYVHVNIFHLEAVASSSIKGLEIGEETAAFHTLIYTSETTLKCVFI